MLPGRKKISGGLSYFLKWDAMARRVRGRNTPFPLSCPVLLTVPPISWIQPDTSHLKNLGWKSHSLVTQSRQGMVENGLWEACRITKMMLQSEGTQCFKDKAMSPFLSKQSKCLQFLIDLFFQLLHIKNLYGVLARTDLHVECWGDKMGLGIIKRTQINLFLWPKC